MGSQGAKRAREYATMIADECRSNFETMERGGRGTPLERYSAKLREGVLVSNLVWQGYQSRYVFSISSWSKRWDGEPQRDWNARVYVTKDLDVIVDAESDVPAKIIECATSARKRV